MVVDVFVTHRDGIQAVWYPFMDIVFGARRIPVIDVASLYSRRFAGVLVDLPRETPPASQLKRPASNQPVPERCPKG